MLKPPPGRAEKENVCQTKSITADELAASVREVLERTGRSPEVRLRSLATAPALPGARSGSIRIDGEPGGDLWLAISPEHLRALARAVLGRPGTPHPPPGGDDCVAAELLNQVAGVLRRRADLPQGRMRLPHMGAAGRGGRQASPPAPGWVGVEARAGWGRACFSFEPLGRGGG